MNSPFEASASCVGSEVTRRPGNLISSYILESHQKARGTLARGALAHCNSKIFPLSLLRLLHANDLRHKICALRRPRFRRGFYCFRRPRFRHRCCSQCKRAPRAYAHCLTPRRNDCSTRRFVASGYSVTMRERSSSAVSSPLRARSVTFAHQRK